jgi:adenylate kinase
VTLPPPSDGVCASCKTKSIVHRKDDQEETIKERLKVYNKTIEPVKNYYESMGKLVVLDASVSGTETYKELKKVLSEIG